VTPYETFHDLLVKLFNEIMTIEGRVLTTAEFRDISSNDMHIIEAIGLKEKKSMSTVAKALSVTVGTLTTAINSLVKKGYVDRIRGEKDRRVVLIFLTEKGEKAFFHHQKFHDEMIRALLADLNEEETRILVHSMINLQNFFKEYDRASR
jgi:DNA-binding MarR family transcriptional regulator